MISNERKDLLVIHEVLLPETARHQQHVQVGRLRNTKGRCGRSSGASGSTIFRKTTPVQQTLVKKIRVLLKRISRKSNAD